MRRKVCAVNCISLLAKRFFASFVFACILVSTGYVGLSRVSAAASPSRIIMYQGRLLNGSGVPVSDATASISFALYSASSGGTCLWSNNSAACASVVARTVTLTAGLFSEPLGDTAAATPYAAIGSTVFSNNAAVYLEVIVNTETLAPRRQMLAAPYAMNSDVLDGYDTSLTGGTSSIVPVTDASGNLVVTGAPQGTGVSQGSLYVNPATTTANYVLFGAAVGGVSEFTVDKEGDVSANGDLALTGGDFTSSATTFNFLDTGIPGTTTLNIASTGTSINIGDGSGTKLIDIGGVTNNGTDIISIATEATSADTIVIGNANAATAVGIVGGTAWSIGGAGLITSAGDAAINGGDFTSSAATFNLLNTGIAGVNTVNFGSTLATLNIGDGAGAKTIDIGGITADGIDAINIATNATSADVVAIGNAHASSTLALTGGTTWSMTSGGLFTTSDSANVGDGVGNDGLIVSSGTTAGKVLYVVDNSLTTGYGINVQRTNNVASEFTGGLALFEQLDAGGGSGGRVVDVLQNGQSASAIGLYVTQAQTSAHSGTVTGANALVIDIQENGSTDDAIIMRSDSDGNGAGTNTTFRVTSGGDTYMDGAMTSASVAVGGADYAEFFRTADTALDGKMLACQNTVSRTVQRCAVGNSQMIGIVSTDPGIIGNNTREDYRDELADPSKSLVGLMGQIDTLVDASGGAVAVGDPISASLTTAGYGAKAHGPTRIVGFALEALSSGTGTIRVLVQPQWYGGDVLTATGSATQVSGSLAIAASTAATASSTMVDSGMLSLRGSVWNAGSAQAIGMSMKTVVNAVDDYKLSVTNNAGTEVASVGNSGDFAIAGKLYPSDRGASQTSKYIYYDGSSGSGGDFMRTNSAGWATGSYDFAEMFPSTDALSAGEVVMFGDATQQVKRSTGETYNRKIAGIVSTRPGFLAGDNAAGNYPIALAGRVPTLVSTENGAIHIGDPLTTSTHPGYAMKATEAGPILGYAADSFSGSTGTVVVYVNVSYYGGAPVEAGPAAENSISQLSVDIEHFDTAGTLNFNGGRLLAVGSMTGANGTWKLESTGDFVTSGRLVELVRSAAGVDVETYAATSRQMTVQLSGTVNLDHGHALVRFSDIDPLFASVIDQNPTYRALVTPYGATGALYVTNRTADGFTITESGAASTGVSVDWLVIAFRRDYAPASAVNLVVPAALVIDSAATPVEISVPSDVLIAPSADVPLDTLVPVVETTAIISSSEPDPASVIVPSVDAAVSEAAPIVEEAAPVVANDVSTESVSSVSVSDTVDSSSGASASVTP